jgi:hypothetical protein
VCVISSVYCSMIYAPRNWGIHNLFTVSFVGVTPVPSELFWDCERSGLHGTQWWNWSCETGSNAFIFRQRVLMNKMIETHTQDRTLALLLADGWFLGWLRCRLSGRCVVQCGVYNIGVIHAMAACGSGMRLWHAALACGSLSLASEPAARSEFVCCCPKVGVGPSLALAVG